MRKWIVAFVLMACVAIGGCGTPPVPVVQPPPQSTQAQLDAAKATLQIDVDQKEIASLKSQIRNPLAMHIENFFRFCIGCVVGIVIGVLVTPVIQILDAGLAATIEKDEGAISVYIAKFFTWIITLFSGKKPALTTPVVGSTTKG